MEKIKYPNSKKYVDTHLVKDRYCNRCGAPILTSGIPKEYPFQCMYCDEDLYTIETHICENETFDYNDLIERTNELLCLDENA